MTPKFVMTMEEVYAIRRQAARERAEVMGRLIDAAVARIKSFFGRAVPGGFHAAH